MTVRFPFTPDMTSEPLVKVFYDEPTNNFSYLVKDPTSNSCAVIDSVANFDYPSGRLSYHSADEIIAYIKLS